MSEFNIDTLVLAMLRDARTVAKHSHAYLSGVLSGIYSEDTYGRNPYLPRHRDYFESWAMGFALGRSHRAIENIEIVVRAVAKQLPIHCQIRIVDEMACAEIVDEMKELAKRLERKP